MKAGMRDAPSRDEILHSRDLLLALSRAARSAQQARTAEDFYRAVGDEIKSIGGEFALLMLEDDRYFLVLVYASYSQKTIEISREVVGVEMKGYRFEVLPESIYARKLASGNAEYVHWDRNHIADAMPEESRFLADQVISIFHFDNSILAPLRVEEGTLGLMVVSGMSLTEEDVPAMDSFAGQIAAGIHNMRLMQKIESELTARRKAEERLGHNRDLLLSLGRAAQAALQVHTEEEIFRVVGEQVKALGFEATILAIGSDSQEVHFRYTTLSSQTIVVAEKLAGVKSFGFKWPLSIFDSYPDILNSGRAVFLPLAGEIFTEILPKAIRAFADRLIPILGMEKGILAPLRVEEEIYGLLVIFGSPNLSEDDLPAVDSFAGQVAISLRNVTLLQKLERELVEHKLAKQALQEIKAKNEALLDALPDLYFVLNLDGVFLDYHAARGDALFASPEFFMGRNIREVLPPEVVSLYFSKLESARQTGSDMLFEYSFELSDVIRYFEAHLVVYQSDMVLCLVRDITERKQAEEAAEKAQKHFKALIENAPDGIALIGLDGKIQYVSPSAMRMFGYPAGEPVTEEPMDFIHPVDSSIVLAAINEMIQNPEYKPTIQYRYKHADRSWHWVESTFSNLLMEPSVQAIVINFRDITERKQAENALIESERKFHGMISRSADGISLTDEHGRIIEFNDAIEQITGLDRSQVMGMYAWDLQHKITPERMRTDEIYESTRLTIQSALETGQADSFHKIVDAVFQRTDGNLCNIQLRVFSIRTEKGWRLGNIARDVTDQKQAEAALAASEAEMRALLAAMRDTVLVIDRNGFYRRVGPTNPERYYIPPEQVIGKHLSDFFPLEEADTFLDIIRQVLELRETRQIEYQILLAGESPWFESSISPMGEDDTLWVARDITDRKKIEVILHLQGAALDAAANSIVITDRKGFIQWANPAFETLTGFSHADVLGKNPRELVKSGMQGVEFYQDMWNQITSGEVWHNELVNRRKDGSLYYEEMTITPLRDKSGEIDHFIAVKQDVTERKKAEDIQHRQFENLNALYGLTALLGQSTGIDEVYRAALDSLQHTLKMDRASILLFDEDGVMRFKAWRGLSETYRTSTEGHSPWRRDTVDPQPLLVEDVATDPSIESLRPIILAEGIHALAFIPLIHQDGLLGKFMLYRDAPHVFNDAEIQMAQTIAGHVVIAIVRQRSERELMESERHYRLLAERMADVVWVVDLKTLKFKYISPSVTRLIGYSVEEVQALALEDFIEAETLARMINGTPARVRDFKAGDPSAIMKSELINHLGKDGSLVYTEAMTTFVLNEKNEIEVIGVSRDVTERKLADDELRMLNQSLEMTNEELHQRFIHEQVLARTDGLTGLCNRRYFFDMAVREFNAGARYQRPVTIILFDVDGFKRANDTFGHAMGDKILAQIAQVAAAQVRDVDILARYGGDEFIILLPQTDARQAFVVAERIRTGVEDLPREEGAEALEITLSLGVAEMSTSPQDISVEDVIRRADRALYCAKKIGRNHAVIFSEDCV
ncbi:MAG TPA: PAS domain S-box protein [Anaerolineales bacterium]|nr:PAS domain S-box protein [Anaerolineales bacterium]